MEINISEIIDAKLEQMDRDGVIKQKIEESLEKTVLNAISSELESYELRKQIASQVKEHVGGIAEQLGLSAYNGFMAQRVRDIVRDLYTADIAQKVQNLLTDVLLKKHENVKLSDIFKAYRKWVNEYVAPEDQRERECYTASLDVRPDENWHVCICRFAEEPDQERDPDITVRLQKWCRDEKATISALYIDGRDLQISLRIGYLTEFESFITNLYFNGTEIELDVDAVDTDASFEYGCDD